MESKKYKVALLFICLNSPYWPYIKPAIEGAKKFFLPNHDVDYFLWSDLPQEITYGATVFDTDPAPWPMPTLMRFHLFLQQEEILKNYDYIFYCDADMLFVDTIGDEILGNGLTAAQHPMYARRQLLEYPLETNPESAAYLKVPTHYFAGGFQGGKSADFIKAMWTIKRNIDADFNKNYVARWNDESHWNRYLFDNPPAVVLSPAYVYPDSMIQNYYEPIWGCSYKPKLITITKPFSVSKDGGAHIAKLLEQPL